MKKEILYLSNLVTLSRFFLLAITAYFLLTDKYLVTLLLIILIWLTDIIDGYLARSRNEVSELGKIIDPAVDKLSVAVIMLILVVKNIVPLWFCVIVILRDVLILAGGYYIIRQRKIVLQSDFTGKLTVFIIGFTFFWFILSHSAVTGEFGEVFKNIFISLELFIYILLFLSIVMIIVSLVSYLREFLTNLKNTPVNPG